MKQLKKIILLLILADVALSSCQSYLTHKYHLSRPFSFKDKKEFAAFMEKQTGFGSDVIYFSDSMGYVQMLKKFGQKNKEGVLWGLYDKDIAFKETEKETEDKLYCKKRIAHIISDFADKNMIPETLFCDSVELAGMRLYGLKNNTLLHLSSGENNKLVILCYATGFGTYYKDLFNTVLEIIDRRDSETRVLIFCLDPVFQLK